MGRASGTSARSVSASPSSCAGSPPTSSAGSASSASAARSADGRPGSRTTGTTPVRSAPSTAASSSGDAAADTSSRSPARSPRAASSGRGPALVPLAVGTADDGNGHARRTRSTSDSSVPTRRRALRDELVQGRPGGLGGGRPDLPGHLRVDTRDQVVDGRRAPSEHVQQLPLPERAVGEVELQDGARVLGELGAVPAVEGAGPEVVHPPQRLQIGQDVALGMGHHRRAAAQDVVPDQHRAGLQPEGQVVLGVAGGRDDADGRARHAQALPRLEHPSRGAGHRSAPGGDPDAEVRRPGQGRLGVVEMVMGDQDGHALGVPRREGGLHGRQVPGVVRAGIDQHGAAAAGTADDVGVGAVEAHAPRIRREHPGDERFQLDGPRHLPGRREVPPARGSAGAVTTGTVAVRVRGGRPAASLRAMRRVLTASVPASARLAVALLAGCGGGSDDDSSSATSTSSSSAEASGTTEADPATSAFCDKARGLLATLLPAVTGPTMRPPSRRFCSGPRPTLRR